MQYWYSSEDTNTDTANYQIMNKYCIWGTNKMQREKSILPFGWNKDSSKEQGTFELGLLSWTGFGLVDGALEWGRELFRQKEQHVQSHEPLKGIIWNWQVVWYV